MGANLAKHSIDIVIAADVALRHQSVFTEIGHQCFNLFFQAITLIGERQSGAGLVPSLSDAPCNRILVGNAKDNPCFTFEWLTHLAGSSKKNPSSWQAGRKTACGFRPADRPLHKGKSLYSISNKMDQASAALRDSAARLFSSGVPMERRIHSGKP